MYKKSPWYPHYSPKFFPIISPRSRMIILEFLRSGWMCFFSTWFSRLWAPHDRSINGILCLILGGSATQEAKWNKEYPALHLSLFLWCYFQSEPVLLTASSIAFGVSKSLKSAKHQNIRGPTWTLGHESHVDRHAADRIIRSVGSDPSVSGELLWHVVTMLWPGI